MKIAKILRNTVSIGIAVAGIISLSSCEFFMPQEEPHTHQLSIVEAKAASCTKEGVEAYYKCNGCDKLFADEKGETEIASPKKISKTEHKEVTIEAKAATCTQDGATEGKKCETCGQVLVSPQRIPHYGILINGTHYCHDTLDDHGIDGLTLTYADGEYTLTGNECEIQNIVVNNITLNVNGKLTIAATDNAISSMNGKINFVGGEVTVNGSILTSESFVTVTGDAVLNLNSNVRIEGASIANKDAEFGYDFRFAVLDGTVNIDCSFVGGAIESDSVQIGSVTNGTEGVINIENLASKGNGFDNIGAFRWVFANGDINCVGNEDCLGTAICMGKSGTGFVDLKKDMTITMKNYDYGFGEWYKGSKRYIGIERGFTMTAENLARDFFYVRGNDTLYAQDYVEMEYTLGEETGTALVKLTRVDTETLSAIKGFENLEFVVFPTAEDENVDIEFIKWVE